MTEGRRRSSRPCIPDGTEWSVTAKHPFVNVNVLSFFFFIAGTRDERRRSAFQRDPENVKKKVFMTPCSSYGNAQFYSLSLFLSLRKSVRPTDREFSRRVIDTIESSHTCLITNLNRFRLSTIYCDITLLVTRRKARDHSAGNREASLSSCFIAFIFIFYVQLVYIIIVIDKQ